MKTQIKKLILLPTLIAGLGLILTESANGGIYNGFVWSLNGNTIEIEGYSIYFVGAVVIPGSIPVQTGTNPDGSPIYTYYPVTSIGEQALANCHSISSITLPNSLTNIGYGAFGGCTSLTSVTIPNNLISIGEWAFGGCTNLTTGVTIPNSVNNIGVGTFANCTSLSSVTIGNGVTNWEAGGIGGQGAFYGCTGLTNVTLVNGLTSIGTDAFDSCTNLTSVTIPNSITNWGQDDAFANCTGLTNVTFVNGLTSIGDFAFYGCISLTSVTIPNSVTSIGDGAFEGSGLTSVTIPNSVTNIGGYDAFGANLTSVTIGSGVTSIGYGAFAGCTRLVNFICLGNAPASVGYSVFQGDNVPKAYYLPGTTGWSLTFWGYPNGYPYPAPPAILWNPQALTTGAKFGVRTNKFGFNITGTSNIVVVVEACTNLSNPVWQPVQTNTLNTFIGTNGTSYFSDSQWTNYRGRFYRLSSP